MLIEKIGGVYADFFSLQLASVEFVRGIRTNYARSKRYLFAGKRNIALSGSFSRACRFCTRGTTYYGASQSSRPQARLF